MVYDKSEQSYTGPARPRIERLAKHPYAAVDAANVSSPKASLEKQLYSIKEFGAVYGVGTTSIYALLKAGVLRAVKIGGLTKIRREDAQAWVAGLAPRTV